MFYGPALWSILVNDPCVFEKNVYSDIWGNINSINGKSNWLTVFQVFYIFTDLLYVCVFSER